MVRGNWQKRVETAEARRREAKQRKQKNEDKRQYKVWVQDSLRLLDQCSDQLLRHHSTTTVHVWTDSLPSDSPPQLLDWLLSSQDETQSKSASRRKQRSNSIEEMSSSGGRKGGRARSSSVSDNKPCKKKVHPRSRESFEDSLDKEEFHESPLLLCQSQFFDGKCGECRGKKSSCQHLHYSSPYKTLHQVLNTNPHSRSELVVAQAAVKDAVAEEMGEHGTMEMIYYCTVNFQGLSDGEQSPDSIKDQIVSSLTQKDIKLSSIVYMTVGDVLVYDRYREGSLFSTVEQLLCALFDQESSKTHRKLSIASEGHEEHDGDDDDGGGFEDLPGSVLEHILTFLPDASVSTTSQVCKSWYLEIGQKSPNLWRQLLERQNWPLPESLNDAESGEDEASLSLNETRRFREAFLSHYSMIRDAKAIQLGLGAFGQTKHVVTEEMVYHEFSRRSIASSVNNCVNVHIWAPNQILAVFEADCSLRLFETVTKSDGSEIACKEIICQKVDPYRNTKKRTCQIITSGVDEECIGCLCEVTADNVAAQAYVLSVITRDEFLMGESSTGGCDTPGSSELDFKVIDVGEAVLNYILSAEVADHEMLEVIDFLQEGGEVGAVDVQVSPTIAACGFGRFMLEVGILIPEDDLGIHNVYNRLVLFSSGVGAIVWMGENGPLIHEARRQREGSTISFLRRTHTAGPRTACTIAVSPLLWPGPITFLDIDPSGQVFQTQIIERPRESLMTVGWLPHPYSRRQMRITSTHLVVVDSLYLPAEGGVDEKQYKTLVTFLPRFPFNESSVHSTIHLDAMVATELACIRDQHCILISQKDVRSTRQTTVNVNDFGGRGIHLVPDSNQIEVWAILLHVPSGREIGRQLWLRDVAPDARDSVMHRVVMTGDANETIGVSFAYSGVVMTGNDVRAVGASSRIRVLADTPTKKKKAKRKKAGKKDGFARGMSLRG